MSDEILRALAPEDSPESGPAPRQLLHTEDGWLGGARGTIKGKAPTWSVGLAHNYGRPARQ